jgi:RNA polymerase subunit RPABC4/transcription elongation factor Spt4
MAHIGKQAVLYILVPKTQYECRDCNMYLPKRKQCTIHGPKDLIQPYGSCGFFLKGKPKPMTPMGVVTKKQSGYVENKAGFSCKRCKAFLPDKEDCQVVDKNSTGDTPGKIDKDACCNAWTVDALRGQI